MAKKVNKDMYQCYVCGTEYESEGLAEKCEKVAEIRKNIKNVYKKGEFILLKLANGKDYILPLICDYSGLVCQHTF